MPLYKLLSAAVFSSVFINPLAPKSAAVPVNLKLAVVVVDVPDSNASLHPSPSESKSKWLGIKSPSVRPVKQVGFGFALTDVDVERLNLASYTPP